PSGIETPNVRPPSPPATPPPKSSLRCQAQVSNLTSVPGTRLHDPSAYPPVMRWLAATLFLACGFLGQPAGAAPAAELTAEEKALFAWYDSPGYPDVTK